MNPLKHQITQFLLPVLLKTNQSQREEFSPPSELYEKMHTLMMEEKEKINHEYINCIASMLELATGTTLPRIKTTNAKFPDNLSVVVVLENTNRHHYTVDKSYIVVHSRDRILLDDKGDFGDVVGMYPKGVRLATDEEVEQCLNDLNTEQVKFILSEALFAPILAPMFDEYELVEAKDLEEDED